MSWRTDHRTVATEAGVRYVKQVDVDRETGQDVRERSQVIVQADIKGKTYTVNAYASMDEAKADVKRWLIDQPNTPRDMISFYTAAHFRKDDESNDGTGINF